MEKRCPRCGSAHIDAVDYIGVQALICLNCGYDESAEMENPSGEKVSQKAKERHTPYKAGGPRRAQKR